MQVPPSTQGCPAVCPSQPCCVKCILHSWCQTWNSALYLCARHCSCHRSPALCSSFHCNRAPSSYLDEFILMFINILEDLHLQWWRGWGHYCLREQHRAETDAIWKLRITLLSMSAGYADILQYTFVFSTRKQKHLQSSELIYISFNLLKPGKIYSFFHIKTSIDSQLSYWQQKLKKWPKSEHLQFQLYK